MSDYFAGPRRPSIAVFALDAEALMEYLAQCAPERIPMTLIEGAIDDETALAALCEVSLVKHDPFDDGAPAVTVHRLVQAVVRARANERRRRASVTLACCFVAVGAVFGVNRLPRGHDLGSNLLRGHIGRRETG